MLRVHHDLTWIMALLALGLVAVAPAASGPARVGAQPRHNPQQPTDAWVLDHYEVIHTEDVFDEVETRRYSVSGSNRDEFQWGGTKIYTGTYPTGSLIATATLSVELPGTITPGVPFEIGGGAVGQINTPGRTGLTAGQLVAYNECYERSVCPGRLESQYIDDISGKSVDFAAPLEPQTATLPVDRAGWPVSTVVWFRGTIGTTTPGDPVWRVYVYAYYKQPQDIPTPGPSYRLEVDADASRLPPSGSTASESMITALMVDGVGSPVAGDALQFALDPPDMGSLATTSGVTDAAGEVRVRYTAPRAEALRGRSDVAVVVTNPARSLERRFNIRIERYRLTLVIDPADIPIEPVWRAVRMTAQVLDFDGAPVEDALLEFRVDPPDMGTFIGTAFIGNRAPTDAAGRVEGFFEPPPPSALRGRDSATIYVTNLSHGGEASAAVRFIGLKVIRTWPPPDARDIELEPGDTIDIEFDRPIDPASVDELAFNVETLWHGDLGAVAEVFGRTIQLRVTADPVPDVGLQVRVKIEGGADGVKGRDGSVMAGPHELRFKTMPAFDPKIIISQVVDDPRDRVHGALSLALKPFVVRVDAGISADSELDDERVAVRLMIPRRNTDSTIEQKFYPGSMSPKVPDKLASRGNTANFVVEPPIGRGGHTFQAELRPVHAVPEKVIAVPPVNADINSWSEVGAARKIGMLGIPILSDDIPGHAWTVSRGEQQSWFAGLGQNAANMLPLTRLDLRLGYLLDMKRCADVWNCDTAPPWTRFMYWAQSMGRTGWITGQAGWRYIAVLVPPGYFDQFADHPDVLANPNTYHDAIANGIWSQRASAPGAAISRSAFPVSVVEVGVSNEALVHVIGDIEGLADSSAQSDRLNGYDLLNDRVIFADETRWLGANHSVMNLGVGFGATWPAVHDYEQFLDIWTQRSCLGPPPCPPRIDSITALAAQPADPAPVLLVSGTIARRAGGAETATVDPLATALGEPSLPAGGDSEYAIELRDSTGATLDRYPFAPAFGPVSGGELAGFMVAVPANHAAAAVAILHGDTVLGQRVRSANPPSVTFTQPQPGSAHRGDVDVAWAGVDADADSLTYSLLFSGDGGLSWEPLLMDSRLTEYVLPSMLVGNGPDARLRVVAMDGYDTGEATLEFALDNPMTVLAAVPADKTRDVPVRTAIEVKLRDALDPGAIDGSTLMLRKVAGAGGGAGGPGALVAGDVGYELIDRTVVFTPTLELAEATTYEARLTGSVRSKDGRTLGADYTWTFTTRGKTIYLPWSQLHSDGSGPAPTPRTPEPWPTSGPSATPRPSTATATATRGPVTATATATASATTDPGQSPTASATADPGQTATPSATPGGGGSATLAGLSTTGTDAAHMRMAFAPGEPITLWIRVENSGSTPVSPQFDYQVRRDSGEIVSELSWNGVIEAPVGTTWFRLERSVPATALVGAHTFTGSVTWEGQATSDSSEFFIARTLRVANDFENPASGWANGSDGSGSWGYFGGEYRITFSRASVWRFAALASSPDLTDLAVEADMRRPGTAAGWVGLIFGLNRTGSDFHLVEIDRAAQYSVYRNVNGAWEPLVSPTVSDKLRTGDANNHLMLVRDSGLTSLYANGQFVTMITDLPAPAGRVGVYASNGDAGLEGFFDTFRGYSLR